MAEASPSSGPDLTLGIPVSALADGGMLQGHVGGEAVLLARRGGAQHPGPARALRRRAVLLEPALRRAHRLRRHATSWDAVEIDGQLQARDCSVAYRRAGRTVAVATIGRDRDSLRAELELERAVAG